MNVFRQLHDGWTVAPVAAGAPAEALATVPAGRPVPATVPGCVHTDLLAAGLIPDPYLDDHEERLAWIGRTDWEYATTFAWRPEGHERVDLVCAGLDTVATVLLNDVEVGRVANMHRSYRFDVLPLLREGDNRLVVRFDSAQRYAERVRDEQGELPHAYDQPFNVIRKMACNFGWDWGPILITSGIWQPVGLHAWSTARLAEVRPLATVAGGDGSVAVHVRVQRAPGADREPLTVRVDVADVRAEATLPAGAHTTTVELTVPSPRLWWPRGHGEQALYPLTATLTDGGAHGAPLDTWSGRIGFRSVRLETGADEHGSAYTVVVNDLPIFVRGTNWIPDDVFPTRVDRPRLAARFRQALDANVNYLRVWGGGRYESEDFYDLADELGLMVGQDFLFACAAYPEDDAFAAEIDAEAREQVTRLTPHPSLLLWTGNNENLWGYHDWGWRQHLDGRGWGLRYYLDLLPSIVAELDPTRPYWPGSPYSGTPDLHPNDPAHGTMHIWDVWNTEDYTRYAAHRPRFVSEFGFQGPPAWATLRAAVSDEPLTPDSPGMLSHQKQVGGNEKLLRRLAGHLPTPAGMGDWHHATQLNQARAVRFGVEHFRSLRPLCMGTILWQINDCWPVTSWSIVDGAGRRKPVWYALRRAYADQLLTIQPRDGGLALVAVNDGAAAWRERVEVVRRTLGGAPLATQTVDLSVAAGQTVTHQLAAAVATATDPAGEVLVAGAGPGRAMWWYAEDVDLACPTPSYQADVAAVPGGYRVTVTAGTLLRDLLLAADRLAADAEVDDALVTLLPGESATFTVRTAERLDPAALTASPVLRCTGHLLTGAAEPH